MLKQVIEVMELLDSALVSGDSVRAFLHGRGLKDIEVKTITGEKGSTDFIKIKVQGTQGKTKGGSAKTLGVIGRLGGIGARPEQIGLVSDADGAIVALLSYADDYVLVVWVEVGAEARYLQGT